MSITQQRSPRELRPAEPHDYQTHELRLFELQKNVGFARDPRQTAEALSHAAMWIDGGASSNVPLSLEERAECLSYLEELEREAYRHLPHEYPRRDIGLLFQTWRRQVDRWATPPANRTRDYFAENLRDVARIHRNRLHNAALSVDVLHRLEVAQRRNMAVHRLMHDPAPAAPAN